LPPPLQSHSHSHSQSHSHSHSHSQSHSQSQIHSQSNSRPTPADSHNDEIHPEDTVKLHCLGHGSSGKVYKVQHKRTGVVYALKVIQEKHELSVRKQILREMDILRRSRSRHVVRCYGSSDKGGEISFLLEYMDAGSFANVLKAQGVIREGHLSEIARQVLQGLDYLHSNHIVHRDIKPSNLLMNRKREVKIADFGVSAVLASTLAPCSSFVGTCAYMSPERFDPDSHGGNYCGYAADIWSLGLTLLECATGHFPFLERGQMADWPSLMVAICYRDPPTPPAHFSPDFRDFITQCLQKDPARRPRACALLSHPFVNPARSNSGSPIADISPLLASLSL
jgi:serine/threonine protein kinase